MALLHKRSALGYDGLTIEPDNLRRITPTDDFYVVTKNIIDPRVRKSLWQLSIGGEVENPMTYDFDALAALPAVEREITLECISNGVGGGLISNARWKGAPMRALLEAARPMSSARQVFLQAAALRCPTATATQYARLYIYVGCCTFRHLACKPAAACER